MAPLTRSPQKKDKKPSLSCGKLSPLLEGAMVLIPEVVMKYLNRESVAGMMNVKRLCHDVHLTEYYCHNHGTKLELKDEGEDEDSEDDDDDDDDDKNQPSRQTITTKKGKVKERPKVRHKFQQQRNSNVKIVTKPNLVMCDALDVKSLFMMKRVEISECVTSVVNTLVHHAYIVTEAVTATIARSIFAALMIVHLSKYSCVVVKNAITVAKRTVR